MDQRESKRNVGSLKSTSSVVELSSSGGDHTAQSLSTKGASTGTYAPVRSCDGYSSHTFCCPLPQTSPNIQQASFDQGGEGRLSSTQVKQRLKAYLLNRRRGRVLANRHWRTDGKVPGSSQNPYTESDFDENLEHSESDSGQQGMCHVVDHWHSADSPGFSEWDLTDENVPVHQHHSLDLDVQRKLTDYNPSIKPTYLSSNMGQTLHTPSLSQSCNISSMLNRVNIHQSQQQEQHDTVELEKSNQFLERLHYHLVSKYNDRLTNEQIQAMIALLKIISQSKRQIKKISSQSSGFEEIQENENCVDHLRQQHNVHLHEDDMKQLVNCGESLPVSNIGADINYQKALSALVKMCHQTTGIISVQSNILESHDITSANRSHSFSTSSEMDWESQLVNSTKSDLLYNSQVNPITLQHLSTPVGTISTVIDNHGDGSDLNVIAETVTAASTVDSSKSNNVINSSSIYCQPHKLASDIWSALPENDWLSRTYDADVKTASCYPSVTNGSLTTAIAFDPDMLEHKCLCPNAHDSTIHPECPDRLTFALERLVHISPRIPSHMLSNASNDLIEILKTTVLCDNPDLQYDFSQFLQTRPDIAETLITHLPLLAFCRLIRARMATEDELRIFHSPDYVQAFGSIPIISSETPSINIIKKNNNNNNDNRPRSISSDDPSSFRSTTIDDHGLSLFDSCTRTSLSKRLCSLTCGGVGVDSDTVWNPCKTARAARLAVGQVLCLAHQVAKRQFRNGFAIVRPPGHHAEPDQAMGFCYFNSYGLDWDIHHGNGTKLAATHPGLVYLSLHRYDGGTFFPGTGSVTNCMDENSSMRTISCQSDHITTTAATIAGNFNSIISSGLSKSFEEGSSYQKDKNGNNYTHTTNMNTNRTIPMAQFINVAWENPYNSGVGGDNAETIRSQIKRQPTTPTVKAYSVDADERRKRWFQQVLHKGESEGAHHSSHLDNLNSSEQDRSSFSSFPHSVSCRNDSDIPCCVCPPNGQTSTGSSQVCSFCLSQSRRSSSLSYINMNCGFFNASQSTESCPDKSDLLSSESNPFHHHQQLQRHQQALPSHLLSASNPYHPTLNEPLLGLSDAEYLAAMRSVVIPVGHEFQPDIILISAGYDAAYGHGEALGGYSVSAGLFAWITHQCMSISNSRIVLALEGGYSPSTVADCITSCINALLLPASKTHWIPVLNGDQSSKCVNINGAQEAWLNAAYWIPKSELIRPPRPEAVVNLMTTIRHHAKTGWKCFTNVSEEIVAMSFSEAIHMEHQLVERNKATEYNMIKSRKLSDSNPYRHQHPQHIFSVIPLYLIIWLNCIWINREQYFSLLLLFLFITSSYQ
ncbi:unnamed protein product [Heterobilharzia americana]|nr:unnamed protein product [Heterobilharzia americana]